MPRWIRRIFKYMAFTLLTFGVLGIGMLLLFYLPASQQWLCRQAESYIEQETTLRVTVGSLRIRFPLRIFMDELWIGRSAQDTVVRCDRIRAEVAIWPLLRGNILLRHTLIEQAIVHYADTSERFSLRVQVGRLHIPHTRLHLLPKSIEVDTFNIEQGSVWFSPGQRVQEATSQPSLKPRSPWRFSVDRVTLRRFWFSLHTPSQEGAFQIRETGLHAAHVDLRQRQVAVREVELHLSRSTLRTWTASSPPDTATSPSNATRTPWSITVEQFRGTDSLVEWIPSHRAPLRLTQLALQVDSFRLCRPELRVQQLHLEGRWEDQEPVEIRGAWLQDQTQMRLSDLQLLSSGIQAEASGLLRDFASSPEHAAVELSLFWESEPEALVRWLSLWNITLPRGVTRSRMRCRTELQGVMSQLRLRQQGSLSLYGSWEVDATLAHITHPRRLQIQGAWKAQGSDHAASVRDTTMPWSLPSHFTTYGHATWSPALGTVEGVCRVDSGTLQLQGRWVRAARRLEFQGNGTQIAVGTILPHTPLGAVSFRAEGALSFPASKASQPLGRAQMEITQLPLYGYDYAGGMLQLDLQPHRVTGHLRWQNPALLFTLDLSASSLHAPDSLAWHALFHRIDLMSLGLSADSLQLSGELRGSGILRDSSRRGWIQLNDWVLTDRQGPFRWSPWQVAWHDTPHSTETTLHSVDFVLHAAVGLPVDSLIALSGQLAQVRKALQDTARTHSVWQGVPPLQLKLQVGARCDLNTWLHRQNMGFNTLTVDLSKHSYQTPPQLHAGLTHGVSRRITIDSLEVQFRGTPHGGAYRLLLAEHPRSQASSARITLSGAIEGTQGSLQGTRQDRQGAKGFDVGIHWIHTDSLWRFSMNSDPIFNFTSWRVNPLNYIGYDRSAGVSADFQLQHGATQIAVHSLPDSGSSSSLQFAVRGVSLDTTLALLPGMPPWGGRLQADARWDTHQDDAYTLNGTLTLDQLTYSSRKVGDALLRWSFSGDSLGEQQLQARLQVDRQAVASVSRQRLVRHDTLLVKDHLSLTHLPFHLANAFLPPATARFGGAVTGEVSLETNAGKPQLQGVLHLDTLSFSIPYVGTSFRIESDTLHIQDNRLPWQDLRIIAPDGSQLSLDGEVRLNPHRRLEGSIRAHTTRFQCMDVKKNPYSTLYGQAYLGLDASAEGLLRALFVRGSITLLQDTELHYLMHSTTMPGMKLQPQDLVTFVNFSDTLSSWQTAPIPTLRLGGMNLQLEGLIDPTVAITLDLSSDGQSRVNVQGGGELTYTLDPQGDSRLMGRYTVQRGEVRYRPPLISEKVFSINPGSYLSWSGSIQDPTLHLTAVENLRVNVSGNGAGGSRTVLFQVIVSIRNTLETLSVTFDLAAPEDLTLQNQLASLTPEQRASQAMNLLVYNTYSVAGTTATTTSNPLNQFLQRELNRWAQNSLRGVDLSFGVNTYEANAQTGQSAHTDYSYRISKALFNHRLQAVIGGKYSTAPNAAENLIDDFSIEYRLSKTQMLFLKLFMQSDYESILEGEVTETGLGFVVRKNGSRFGDLFRFFRSKADRVGAQP